MSSHGIRVRLHAATGAIGALVVVRAHLHVVQQAGVVVMARHHRPAVALPKGPPGAAFRRPVRVQHVVLVGWCELMHRIRHDISQAHRMECLIPPQPCRHVAGKLLPRERKQHEDCRRQHLDRREPVLHRVPVLCRWDYINPNKNRDDEPLPVGQENHRLDQDELEQWPERLEQLVRAHIEQQQRIQRNRVRDIVDDRDP
mmetsp:Transcript_1664/g.5561  ORF Transcript_1664/g.5561 Transcript_1664/m.5561 type:complete len:200 (-) Transcript_1664:820-1419(-)